MYAGLTKADRPALLDAKNYGKWIAKDSSGILYAYRNKPIKKQNTGEWYDMTWVSLEWIYISFIQWSDAEPVNISLALAQIAEMEKTPVLVECYTDPIAPPTHKSVLLERWAKDTEAMARVTVWEKYNILSRTFVFENFATQSFHEAVGYMIAYLNSAAEVGK